MPRLNGWMIATQTPTPVPSIQPYIVQYDGGASWVMVTLGGALVLTGVVALVVLWLRRPMIVALRREFEASAASAVASVEASLPPTRPSLEDEIGEVSGTLSATVNRLREISAKAEAFEAEVKQLVVRADAARATAALDEEKARQISFILGERTERKFREEIEKLAEAHAEQVERLRKSGNRTAWWTFVLGSALGFLLNLLAGMLVA
ncbi:hypothetical protein [Micromonospora sp. DT47]|uniref:hypothetical protein n=1 Tax=Micromonospora sp. DT47 TaxID=3393431 RepID=UPI003CE9ABEE